jgi:assimilatory nitrate reductase catalytic subunit
MLTAATPAVRSTCPYCGVGCGVVATPDGRGGAAIKGDADHPSNAGKLCSKGSALGETLGLETRLLYPQIDGQRVAWDQALDHVATGLQRVIAQHGPQSVAFYLSGQLLTEDYYVANKLAKGFLGTPHVDTNSRLCMASSVAGHRRAFGGDVVPQCYDDLELTDLVVLAGSNAAWCHPILYQRIQIARAERGVRVVNIDPRVTATSEGVDLQLSIKPGTDAQLWNGLLVWLADKAVVDQGYIARHTDGYAAALAEARAHAGSIAVVAEATGLKAGDIETFYAWFAGTPRVVSCYSQGVNQSAQGTGKVNAIINCHLATGRIGQPGSGPFSFTGQPNAMGGREVGGLANMLAAHMGFSAAERDRVRRFWSAPNIVEGEGLKAVQMFDAIERGEIKALWVMGTNPAVSLPRADHVRRALDTLDLFVISENVRSNDTANCASVRLPAAAWGEKDGTVTNSERRISRQRAFLPLPGEVKADWWIMAGVAQRFGWGAAFDYTGPAQIFAEHARLSGFENAGERAFDIAAFSQIDKKAYDAFQPVQWPVPRSAARNAVNAGTARLFADGRFVTPNGKARFATVAEGRLARTTDAAFPFVLNTGRIRDQWHTMTRSGLSPRLTTHIAEPFVEIHPDDAGRLGLEQGTIARVETAHGAATLRVLVNKGQQPGSLFAPIHWSAENSSDGRVGAMVTAATDPFSGQPESKATPARISAVPASAYGYLLTRTTRDINNAAYWARASFDAGVLTYFALNVPSHEIASWAASHLPVGETVSVTDARSGLHRFAVLKGEHLDSVLFIGPSPKLPGHDWLKTQFARAAIPETERGALLAGRPSEGVADQGPMVCVCFQVGATRIASCIASGARSVDAVGAALGAGTNCGSCRPEIQRLIQQSAMAQATSSGR